MQLQRVQRIYSFAFYTNMMSQYSSFIPGLQSAPKVSQHYARLQRSYHQYIYKQPIIQKDQQKIARVSKVSAMSYIGYSGREANFEPTFTPSITFAAAGANVEAGADAVVFGQYEAPEPENKDAEAPPLTITIPQLAELNTAANGVYDSAIKVAEFKGKAGSTALLNVLPAGGLAQQVFVVGLGKKEDAGKVDNWGATAIRAVGTAAGQLAYDKKLKSISLVLPEGVLASEEAASQLSSGIHRGVHAKDMRFKKQDPKAISELKVTVYGGSGDLSAGAAKGIALASGSMVSSYLVEAPPNVCKPPYIAELATQLASTYSDVMSCKILEEKDCKELGMDAYLCVSACSDVPPKFIHLTYKPKGEVKKKIALVGKGVTFDSGGYNIKMAMIEQMKFDMGGCSAIMGAARAVAQLQPPNVEVHFISATCENLVGGSGLLPGDIVHSAAGQSIEINNTDAEGRLTLCDAMWYAQEKVGVDVMLDIATLTGACMVALGKQIAAMYSEDKECLDTLNSASKQCGEKVWQLPLENDYFAQFDSYAADFKNTGSRWGGSITAALFLQKFVNKGVKWVHIDMAGPVYDDKSGATGYGGELLARWVCKLAEGKE